MPLRIKYLLIALTGFWSHLVFAGDEDSLMPTRRSFLSLKPAFDFDQRFSYIKGKLVNIWGERGGILVNDKFKLGIGGYYMNQSLQSIYIDQNGNPLYYAQRNLYFGTVYIEPFLLRKTYWELSVPIELGVGADAFTSYDTYSHVQLVSSQKIFLPIGTGLSLSLKCPKVLGWSPPSWFGINFLGGYRYSALDSEVQTDFNGLFWSISGTIFFDRVFDDMSHWRTLRKAKKAGKPLPKTG
jgi:hypothetical protein